MKRLLVGAALLALITPALSAQVWSDTFTRPDNVNVGNGWVEDRGLWNLVSNQAEAEQIFLWQYCTQPTIPSIQDTCVDCTVTYNTASSQVLQFGGVALRANGAATDSQLIMVKLQDNNSNGQFDSLWLYERPGGATASTSGWTPTASGRVRLLAIDNEAMAFLDHDLDGKWDVVLRRTVVLAPAAGPVGIAGFGGVWIDDFDFYDAVIMPLASNPAPTPGAKIDYKLRGNANETCLVATSFGNAGIPIDVVRTIPLTFDTLVFVSVNQLAPTLFINYSSTMDANGDATASIQLPSIPALVGTTIYTSFVNLDSSNLITAVSNGDQLTIQ